MMIAGRAAAVAVGLLLDRALGEPPTPVHPVAWFGTAMQRVEDVLWQDTQAAGVRHVVVGVALGAAAGAAVRSTAVGVAISVAGRSLRSTGRQVGDRLHADDISGARSDLRSLVGRDASELDASGVAAAVIESVAENSVDAVVAPVFWGLIAGAPGTLAYRAINTMDAMVGHHNDRFENFGWAAARLDDVANYVPARCFAALVALTHPGQVGRIVELIQRDASAHPSPNAGVAETAVAAALGIELGGPLRYGDRVEARPTLGDGPRPRTNDIEDSIEVANRVEIVMVVGLLAAAAAGWPRRVSRLR